MPIVTISRGTYTGGQALAEALAKRLGYPCLSREDVLKSAAASFGVPLVKLTHAMDNPPSFWERLIGDRTHYINLVRASLFEQAARDQMVIHGHVMHLLMAGISHVIRIRVIQDMENRIRIAMERHHFGRGEAIAHVKRADRERSQWTRFLHGIDWNDPSEYDAVLNLGHLGVDGACDLVAHMTELEVFRPTAQSLKAMDDLALGSRVWATLANDPTTAGADLKVMADGGLVEITGVAGSWDIADAIPSVALRVPGVRDVRSDVSVAPPVYDVSI